MSQGVSLTLRTSLITFFVRFLVKIMVKGSLCDDYIKKCESDDVAVLDNPPPASRVSCSPNYFSTTVLLIIF